MKKTLIPIGKLHIGDKFTMKARRAECRMIIGTVFQKYCPDLAALQISERLINGKPVKVTDQIEHKNMNLLVIKLET